MPTGELTESSDSMAELLADRFASVFVAEVPVSPSPHQVFGETMQNIVNIVENVHDVLLGLDVNTSMGPDDIHPQVLRVCAQQLAVPLTIIFNKSLAAGLLPSLWFESVIVPLFKTKSRYDSVNYRPISSTYVRCKVMERILVSELVLYLESNGLMSNRQFSFH